eukprot:ANDGO_07312.mRNA.1 hypothetical protein
MFISIGRQLTVRASVRPVWETCLACLTGVVYFALFSFVIILVLKRGPSGLHIDFAGAVDLGPFDYEGQYWWIHGGMMVFFGPDA